MQLNFTPMRMDAPLVLERVGDALIVNGETFDFGPLPEGERLPADAIPSELFTGPVTRLNGELTISLVLPHGANAPHETRFPAPLTLTADGPVTLPLFDTPEEDSQA